MAGSRKDASKGKKKGRPRVHEDPRRTNLIFDAHDLENLKRFVGWRQNREGVEVSMSRALIEALRENPLFQEWRREHEG